MNCKCSYKGCKAESVYSFEFDPVANAKINAELPLCLYHLHICMGNHFCVRTDTEDPKGPEDFEILLKEDVKDFQLVELIEQVMAARELSRLAKDTTEK